ncbi:hypothetical protein B0H63DRAFT_525572 [Podospora didyma]|uniref:2EXR domain-containing protein n=1 Tax=Podospora didyma TaxID=330526 RepID=A0AAE0KLW8_9PEZI|nr:hypothetical protein B0H63DRAFT_525572 [Podospora didyma]
MSDSSWLSPALGFPHGLSYNASTSSSSAGGSGNSYWIHILIKITILLGWFNDRLRGYARLLQEHCKEKLEELRIRHAADEAERSRKSGVEKTTPTTFPQFGRLPAELRQQIWAEALPGPRVLMLRVPGSSCCSVVTTARQALRCRTRGRSNVWACDAKPPVGLGVNNESRAVALRHYRLGLAPGQTQPRIYVDFRRDVIGLPTETMESTVGRNLWRLTRDIREIRHLALSTPYATPSSLLETSRLPETGGLDSIEDVALVKSPLWAIGIVPAVARLDWAHWMAWQCSTGDAVWQFDVDHQPKDGASSRSPRLSWSARMALGHLVI